LSTRRATPKKKIATETTISEYQRTICHVSSPANVSRVSTLVKLLEFLGYFEEIRYCTVVGHVEDGRLGI
jgi:hypothetical protein